MSKFKTCFKYDRKAGTEPDKVFIIMMIIGTVMSVLLMTVTAFNKEQRGVHILFMLFVAGFVNPGNKAIKPLIMESPLRKYYLCMYRPLLNIISVTICWIVFIVPYAVIQRHIGAEWFYTASMCLGMSVALTAVSVSKAVATGNDARKMIVSYLSAYIVFMPLMLVLMDRAEKFRSAVAAVTDNGNIVFAVSVLLLIFSDAFCILFPKLFYNKTVCKPVVLRQQ